MRRQILLSLVAGALAACSGEQPARKCTTEADCPADARCRAGVCVENSPPVAAVSVPPSPVEFALVTLSGEASTDPDPEDAAFTYRWTVRSAGASCPPPVVASTTAAVQVRFGCAGRHEVELVVEDGLGAASAPATAMVEVAAAQGTPVVTAGADVSLGHTCAGDPLRCAPSTAGGLVSLTATGPTAAGIGYRWIVQPPAGRELSAGRRVTFTPGADVKNPTMKLETDGLAISGDWVFRVEAYDGVGVVGAAATRVSIGNRPPVVDGTLGPVPHQFVQMSQRFEAAGAIAVSVSDPDGDPITRQVTAHQLNAGPAATFTATDHGATISFAIVVPFAGAASPGWLIGGPGLSRDVELTAQDANGASTKGHWDVVVANRKPEVDAGMNLPVQVDHTFVSPPAYSATAELSSWNDPDGDPLESAPVAATGPCGQPFVTGSKLWVTCTVPYTGSPAASLIAGSWSVAHAVRDPWTTVAHTREVVIGNRSPVFLRTGFTASATCSTTSICCEFDMGQCVTREREWPATQVPSGVWLEDPDGDPLLVTFAAADVGISPSTSVCRPGDCQFVFSVPPDGVCGLATPASFTASISDGGPVATVTQLIDRVCR